ncbi:MAG: TonB-dependent receptor [Bacteroidales bacterium]
MKFLLIVLIVSFSDFVFAQNLHGTIKEFDKNKKLTPLPGASVRWAGTNYGAITDMNGEFLLKKVTDADNKMIVSYVGYKTDTINIAKNQAEIKIILTSSAELKEVVIKSDLDGAYISKIKPLYTTNITGAGLQKAACCNLAESFQNSATVDINYSDAVTGAKQIQMLGLSGIYSQVLIENVPAIRGIATTYGLGYVPGSWMESIQVSKGASSVVNGYESITGQINVEYKKPDDNHDKLFLNIYGNDDGRYELNANTKIKLNDRLSTMFLLHGEDQDKKIDMNHDGFMDMPLMTQVNFANRWDYIVPGKFTSRTMISVLDENRLAGQMNVPKNPEYGDTSNYNINVSTKRYQFYTKNGFMFPSKPGTSIGTIISGTYHGQNSIYGLNKYDATEKSFYANLLYENNIFNPNNKLTSGASFLMDEDNEHFEDKEHPMDTLMNRKEYIPGVFSQYTLNIGEVFTGIVGIRADYNSQYGWFVTPRLHLRYNIGKHTTLRASAGKGYRVANVLPENSFVLASSRKLVFDEKLKPEQAWNYGISGVQDMKIFKRDASLSVDFFRTDFINQIIVDMDRNPSEVFFYNLNGRSYSNSAQAEFTFQPLKRLDVTSAFRYNDVKTTIDGQFMDKPFASRYKALLTLSYATNKKNWQFDFTTELVGNSRLPYTGDNPVQYQRPSESPAYTLLYAQVTRRFKLWEIYVGGENLTNFTQKYPVIGANDPFGSHFDTSIVWGPILGRMVYAGIRVILKD